MVQKNEVNFDNVFNVFGTKNHNHLGLHDHFLIPLLFYFFLLLYLLLQNINDYTSMSLNSWTMKQPNVDYKALRFYEH